MNANLFGYPDPITAQKTIEYLMTDFEIQRTCIWLKAETFYCRKAMLAFQFFIEEGIGKSHLCEMASDEGLLMYRESDMVSKLRGEGIS